MEEKQECKVDHEQECWEEVDKACTSHPKCETVVEEKCNTVYRTVCPDKEDDHEDEHDFGKKAKKLGVSAYIFI